MTSDPSKFPPGAYDPDQIGSMIRSLGKGNPGRDATVRGILRKISDHPNGSGLAAEVVDEVRQALKPGAPLMPWAR